MVDTDIIEFIKLLVNTQKLLLQDMVIPTPHNYPSLLRAVQFHEWWDEIHYLEKILKSPESFQEEFRERCDFRAKQNANSALSLLALMEGSVNELYWEIALALYKPKNLREMLAIILPDIKKQWQFLPENSMTMEPFTAKSLRSLSFSIIETDIELAQEVRLESLKELIVVDSHVFDLNSIAMMPFNLRKIFFTALEKHRELAEKICLHNDALKELHKDIIFVEQHGRSNYEIIQHLIQDLRLGGMSKRGTDKLASPTAQVAFIDFLHYWNNLDTDTQKTLGQLTNVNHTSLSQVIDFLKADNCVEMAANYLQGILENPKNHPLLHTHLEASDLQLKSIGKKHRKIAIDGAELTTALPLHYLQEHLSLININNLDDYLNLILVFPSDYYRFIFKFATIGCILPDSLGKMMSEGVFNQEQLMAINQAIADSVERLGGLKKVTQFLIYHNNIDLLKLLIQRNYGNALVQMKLAISLLKWLAYCSPQMFSLVFNTLPTNKEKLATLQKKDGDCTLLCIVVQNPASLAAILPLYQGFAGNLTLQQAMLIENDNHENSYELACRKVDSIRRILENCPRELRVFILLSQNSRKKALINEIIERYESRALLLQTILPLLPEEDVVMLFFRGKKPSRTFDPLVRFSSLYATISNFIPQDSHVETICEIMPILFDDVECLNNVFIKISAKNQASVVQNYLKQIVKKPQYLRSILTVFPAAILLTFIRNSNETLVGDFIATPNSLETLLPLLSANDQLRALVKKDSFNQIMLDTLMKEPERMFKILELIKDENRYAIIMYKDPDRNTLFHFACKNTEFFKNILALFTNAAAKLALEQENKRGYSAIHRAARTNIEVFAVIVNLFKGKNWHSILARKNCRGLSFEDYLLKYPEALKLILETMTMVERWRFVTETNNRDKTLFQKIASNAACQKTLFPNLGLQELAALVKAYIHTAKKDPQRMFSNQIPEGELKIAYRLKWFVNGIDEVKFTEDDLDLLYKSTFGSQIKSWEEDHLRLKEFLPVVTAEFLLDLD